MEKRGKASRTSTVSRKRKTKDRDEIAKYVRWAGCGKGENRHVWIEHPQPGQLLIIRTRGMERQEIGSVC